MKPVWAGSCFDSLLDFFVCILPLRSYSTFSCPTSLAWFCPLIQGFVTLSPWMPSPLNFPLHIVFLSEMWALGFQIFINLILYRNIKADVTAWNFCCCTKIREFWGSLPSNEIRFIGSSIGVGDPDAVFEPQKPKNDGGRRLHLRRETVPRTPPTPLLRSGWTLAGLGIAVTVPNLDSIDLVVFVLQWAENCHFCFKPLPPMTHYSALPCVQGACRCWESPIQLVCETCDR